MLTAFLDGKKNKTAMEAAHQNHADSEDFGPRFKTKLR